LRADQGVSRTAIRMNQSQPAISAALKRLREIFGDPLLVRDKNTMVPTARALTVAAQARAALALLDGLYEHSPWIAEAALAQRPFRSLAHLKHAMVQVLAASAGNVSLAARRGGMDRAYLPRPTTKHGLL